MIVKIKRSNSSWSYYEGNSISYDVIELAFSKLGYPDWIFLLKEDTNCKEQLGNKIMIDSGNRHIATVITNKPCYLMNDEGKTIDRIG